METQIKTEDYEIVYEPDNQTITCKGSLWMSNTEEYAPLAQILNGVTAQQPPMLTLDLRQLDFLNSSGINVISKFVIGVRQKGNIELVVLGSKEIPWQNKSLFNLTRLLPAIKLVIS